MVDKNNRTSSEWPGVKRLEAIQREVMKSLGIVRLSVNLNMGTAKVLKDITLKSGISYTESIRRIISVASFLYKESRAGRRIVVTDKRGKIVKEIFLN